MSPPPDNHKDAMARLAAAALENLLETGSRIVFETADAPLVSVLLVLHGRAELTLRCLLSLRGESVPIEIILVDNASSDATTRLLEHLDGVSVARNQSNLGFLLAANHAARLARGELLLFLNNDCELLPGSLASAVSVLMRDPGVGAVGGKLILLDGSLQEAGSIVWSDGSCTGYGRSDSPLAPPYMFERDVDFCSGAFLLTRREVFLGCGGFDPAFEPAYYEDADYCLRLWNAGRRVIYDPRAIALHFEFASSPSPADALALQAAQRPIFLAKHAQRLRGQHAPLAGNLLAARARDTGLRILFIDERAPHPMLGTGFPRARAILSSLVRSGHSVTLYPLTHPWEAWESVYASVPHRVEVMLGHGLERFVEFRHRRQGYYDVVIVSREQNLRRILRVVGDQPLFGATPIVYDAEALSCLREVARRRLMGETVGPVEIQRLIAEETALARRAYAVTSVSEAEAAPFRAVGFESVVTLGHVVEAAPTSSHFEDRGGLLFVGAVPEDASPNADALAWLVTEILPRLQQILGEQIPLIIAGVNHSARVDRLRGGGVTCLGPVEDLTPLYERARLFVAPTRFASGLPTKVYDAAARGLPIVCTSLLATQVGWRDRVELLVADDADRFAQRCAELYSDPELWMALRAAALLRVAEECSPLRFDAALATVLAYLRPHPHQSATAATAESRERMAPMAGLEPALVVPGASLEPQPAPAPIRRLDDRNQRLSELARALADARRDVADLHNSWSWRITAPLRALHAMLVKLIEWRRP